jgi:hypothetical protein
VDAIDLGKLIERAVAELGPNASDDDVSGKVVSFIESLNDADRAAVVDQIVKGTSSTQLAHLRKVLEASAGGDIS